jgi:hypothetical protein
MVARIAIDKFTEPLACQRIIDPRCVASTCGTPIDLLERFFTRFHLRRDHLEQPVQPFEVEIFRPDRPCSAHTSGGRAPQPHSPDVACSCLG